MSETRLARDDESPRGSSNEGDSVGMTRECLLSMKEMFDQLVSNLKQEHPVAQAAAPSRAPIDKLAQHRAYIFRWNYRRKA
ncbi:hypothetical protein V6N13_043096 [Hibiscus sabdariffa]